MQEQLIDTMREPSVQDPQPIHASKTELQRLVQLFDGTTATKPKRLKPIPQLKVVQNRVMNSMDLRRMHYFRYGTE